MENYLTSSETSNNSQNKISLPEVGTSLPPYLIYHFI